MKQLKLFIENFLVYGLGGIISKAIPLIMVPFITRLMPDTSYFGISDLSSTIVQFASALAVMGMYDAMYRMFFEKEEHIFQVKVCSTAMGFTLMTSVVAFVLLVVFKQHVAKLFFGDSKYSYVVYISAMATLVGSTNSIVSAPTRMQNQRKVFLLTNTLSPIIAYAISIPILLKGYYVVALPLAMMISAFVMEGIFVLLNKKWFSIRCFDTKLLKEMLIIAIPLLPNLLVYWVFNSSDRVMITNILSVADAGIYSVGAKIGQVSQLIYTAFAGGWQYFAFSTMKEKNQVESNSKVFEYLGVIAFAAGICMCALSYPIFRILFVGEYVLGYQVAPYLFIAPLLQMLFQVAGNQFLVIKKTWPNMLILSLGAFANVILNLVLIPLIGIEGAAIATVTGYIISVICAVIVLKRMKLIIVSRRFLGVAGLTVVYFVIWRCFLRQHVFVAILFALAMTVFFAFAYRKDLRALLAGLNKKEHS